MSDTILIRGFTASDPALSTLPNGVPVVKLSPRQHPALAGCHRHHGKKVPPTGTP